MRYKKIREIIVKRKKIRATFANYTDFLCGYLGCKKKEYIIKTKDGMSLYVREKKGEVSDIDIIKEVFLDNEYGIINSTLEKNMTILDIGSNIGCFAIKYSSYVTKGRIYCFEPIKRNFQYLKKNISLNKLENVTIYNKAIAKKNGYIEIYLSNENVGGHSIFGSSGAIREKIKAITLKTFFKDNKIDKIDLMKLDCEGAEYEILLSCPKAIFKKIDHIIMEQHITKETLLQYKKDSIILCLKKNGFNVTVMKETYYRGEGLFYLIDAKKI